MLIGRDIKKTFDKNQVLHGIDVSVVPGKLTAVIGPSGGGKSTLLRALSLLDPPDSGSVTVDEVTYAFPRVNANHLAPPWPKLTVVFQQLFLWPHLTIRQNILLPLEKHEHGRQNGEVNALIELFELGDFVERYPNEVSLGQRQRAALVRALALKPKYLLLDEITSALDVEHVSKILEHLQTLKEQGTGILLVTHLIGFAKHSADQVVFMENGRILESGGPALLTSPSNGRLLKFLSLVETAV
jgi:ABC-type polar amino acid transport system ATPase subunit